MTDFGSPIGSVTGLALEHAPSVESAVYKYLYYVNMDAALTKYCVHKLNINTLDDLDSFYFNVGEKSALGGGGVNSILKYGNYGFIPTVQDNVGTITRINFGTFSRVDAITLTNFDPSGVCRIEFCFQVDEYGYYVVYRGAGTARVYKVNLSTFVQIGYIDLITYFQATCCVVDSSKQIALIGGGSGYYCAIDLTFFALTDSSKTTLYDGFGAGLLASSGDCGIFFLINSINGGCNAVKLSLSSPVQVLFKSILFPANTNEPKSVTMYYPNSRYIYTVCANTGYLAKIDPVTMTILTTFTNSNLAYGNYSFAQNQNMVYLCQQNTLGLHILNLESMSFTLNYTFPSGSRGCFVTLYD